MSFVAINPEIDASKSTMPIHKVHGTQVSVRTVTSSAYSVNNISWNVVPPNMNTFVNRAIEFRVPMQIVFNSTIVDPLGVALVLENDKSALRSLSGLRMQLNSQYTINGQGLNSQQVYQIADIVAHYKREYRRKHPLGAVDNVQYYPDAVGSLSNPLSDYNDCEGYEGGMKRGAFRYTSIAQGAFQTTLQFDLIDYLYYPDLLGLDKEDELGLLRIRNFDVNMSLQLDSKHIWSQSYDALKTLDSEPVFSLTSAPSLLVKYVSVAPDMLPKEPLMYNHTRMEVFQTAYGALGVNGLATINSNNIQLSNVPKFVFMFVRESDANKVVTDSDTFCAINNVSINFNNQVALCSSMSQNDLWRASKEVGLIDSLDQFKGLSQSSFTTIGTMGSLVGLSFGKHISLDGLEVGQGGAFNFNVAVQATNVNQNGATGALTNATLFVVIAYDQTLVIDEGGLLTIQTPLAQGVQGDVSVVPYHHSFDVGGSIGSFFGRINDFLKKNKIISSIANAVAPALAAIPTYGGPASQAATTIGKMAANLGYGAGTMNKNDLKRAMQKL